MVEHLTIIGTSHIAKESVTQVKRVIEELKPSFVAVELDRARAQALLSKKTEGRLRLRDIRRVGLKGFLFSLIGAYVERKLGERVGTAPGSEMKAALLAAKQSGAQVVLIDQDILVTLKKISHALSWKEKWHFLIDALKGLFGHGQAYLFDLSQVPQRDLILQLTAEVKKRYPNLYHVLVTERNRIMARNLAQLIQHSPEATIVAVVGAGHEEEITRLVKKYLKTNT